MKRIKHVFQCFAIILCCICGSSVAISQTTFSAGDLQLVGVNSNISGGSDDYFIMTMVDITTGTSFSFTDNGYERVNANQWGDTEGGVTFTYNGLSTISAGTVIYINKPNTGVTNSLIAIGGVPVTGSWTQTSLGIGSSLNASSSGDHIWIMQGGTWTNPAGSHNTTWTGGTMISGFAIDNTWGVSSGTNKSNMFPGNECFNIDMNAGDRMKYTGPSTATTVKHWRSRLQDPDNWTTYASTAAFDAGGIDYRFGHTYSISSTPGLSSINWTGTADSDWCNCENWSGLVVPDSTFNITIAATASNNAVFSASCKTGYTNDLTITGSSLVLEGDRDYILDIHGSIQATGGLIDMDDGNASTLDGTIRIKGDYMNSNATLLDEGNGLFEFYGGFFQQVDVNDFNVMIINKTADVMELGGNVQVTDSLIMLQGEVDGNGLIFEIGSDISNRGTLVYSGGFISGKCRRWFTTATNSGDASSLFPIGKSEYRPAKVEFTSVPVTGGHLTGEFILDTMGTSGIPILQPSSGGYFQDIITTASTGYWQIDAQAGALSNADYTITIYPNNFSEIGSIADLTLVKRPASIWMADGVHVPPTGTAANPVLSRNGVRGFSGHGPAMGGIVLDDAFVQLDAQKDADYASLNWTAFASLNIEHFVIERSVDGFNFNPIETIDFGTLTTKNELFEFLDVSAGQGTNYYRIKMVTENLSEHFSNIAVVEFGARVSDILVYPSVVNDVINIDFSSGTEALYRLEIFDMNGRLVLHDQILVENGQKYPVSIDLPAGTYLVNINGQNSVTRTKIVKL